MNQPVFWFEPGRTLSERPSASDLCPGNIRGDRHGRLRRLLGECRLQKNRDDLSPMSSNGCWLDDEAKVPAGEK